MLIHNENFNIMQIAQSGQCFRMNPLEDIENRIKYGLIAYGKYLELIQLTEDTVELSCSEEEFEEIWKDYFDLSYDYGRIVRELLEGEDAFLKEAAQYGRGIRILKQDPFEATVSFIISQNKNIPAIKNCIEAICERYGERKYCKKCDREYTTFPSPLVLAQAKREDLRTLKTGYRDEYIIRAAQAIVQGEVNFEEMKKCSYEESITRLKTIHGVGEKVANCISLYGLHHIEGFPVDVWILRVLKEIYNDKFEKNKYTGYVGIIQQYMFYYMRYLKGAK